MKEVSKGKVRKRKKEDEKRKAGKIKARQI
jgi:hypothetical protein